MMTAAQTLAEFAVKLQFEKIPQAVVESAKDCVIDIVGVCAFGSGLRILRLCHAATQIAPPSATCCWRSVRATARLTVVPM